MVQSFLFAIFTTATSSMRSYPTSVPWTSIPFDNKTSIDEDPSTTWAFVYMYADPFATLSWAKNTPLPVETMFPFEIFLIVTTEDFTCSYTVFQGVVSFGKVEV